jgi:hypothetical protein
MSTQEKIKLTLNKRAKDLSFAGVEIPSYDQHEDFRKKLAELKEIICANLSSHGLGQSTDREIGFDDFYQTVRVSVTVDTTRDEENGEPLIFISGRAHFEFDLKGGTSIQDQVKAMVEHFNRARDRYWEIMRAPLKLQTLEEVCRTHGRGGKIK